MYANPLQYCSYLKDEDTSIQDCLKKNNQVKSDFKFIKQNWHEISRKFVKHYS